MSFQRQSKLTRYDLINQNLLNLMEDFEGNKEMVESNYSQNVELLENMPVNKHTTKELKLITDRHNTHMTKFVHLNARISKLNDKFKNLPEADEKDDAKLNVLESELEELYKEHHLLMDDVETNFHDYIEVGDEIDKSAVDGNAEFKLGTFFTEKEKKDDMEVAKIPDNYFAEKYQAIGKKRPLEEDITIQKDITTTISPTPFSFSAKQSKNKK